VEQVIRMPRIAIWGAGGIGGFFGGRLAAAGCEVGFIARGAHLEAIRRDGLRVESVDGDFTVTPSIATDDPAEIGPVDVVILGVKTWHLPEVMAGLGPLLGSDTAVVTTQNGVEAPGEVAAEVGESRVLPGIAKVFTEVAGPGVIRHAGGPGSLAFAEWDGSTSARVKDLRATLAHAGVALEEPEDIWLALWIKFLFVVPLGGVGAVAQAPVGVVRSMPSTRALLTAGMREVRDIGRARGIGFPDEIVESTLGFVDQQPPAGLSSLQRDIAAGRPSELEAWSGAVHRLGQEAGVETPVNTFVYSVLLPREQRARGQLDF
jgi:2-dehydropantoate 2-reductase